MTKVERKTVDLSVDKRIGLSGFAKLVPARGAMFSARRRLGLGDTPASVPPPPAEEKLSYARTAQDVMTASVMP
jgi:hypothetical protein